MDREILEDQVNTLRAEMRAANEDMAIIIAMQIMSKEHMLLTMD